MRPRLARVLITPRSFRTVGFKHSAGNGFWVVHNLTVDDRGAHESIAGHNGILHGQALSILPRCLPLHVALEARLCGLKQDNFSTTFHEVMLQPRHVPACFGQLLFQSSSPCVGFGNLPVHGVQNLLERGGAEPA